MGDKSNVPTVGSGLNSAVSTASSINKATEIENTYLKLLNKEMDDKNVILKSNNSLLEQRIKTLESETTVLRNASRPQVDDAATDKSEPWPQQFAVENLLYELKERENRKFNFILFNCPESTTDINEIARNVTDHCLGRETQSDLQVFRLGRVVAGKNRPIKVICGSSGLASEVIRFSKKIKTHNNLKHLSISEDRTPQQLQEYRKLKQQLDERIKAGETNLRIVYKNGSPKIITINLTANLN